MTKLNKISSTITEPISQGASQAMLYAVGLTETDMKKAQVGIASVWYEGNPCNIHLLDLATEVKKGVSEAGMVGMRFNTVGVSDGISMGTNGMRYSLQSREIIADSIETIMDAQWYKYPYGLKNLQVNKSNMVWCSDISYIKLGGGFVYVVAVVDIYSRAILDYEISNTLEVDSCVRCPERCTRKYGKPKIFNTDQGA